VVVQAVIDFVQEELGGKVTKVNVSARLTDSPCILVTSQHGWSANMQRIMKSQPMGDNRAMEYMKGDKIMEINPDNEARPCDPGAALTLVINHSTDALPTLCPFREWTSFARGASDLVGSYADRDGGKLTCAAVCICR
jgi:hypothetical protein